MFCCAVNHCSNFAVMVVKLLAYLHTGSATMLSEAVHSLADMINQVSCMCETCICQCVCMWLHDLHITRRNLLLDILTVLFGVWDRPVYPCPRSRPSVRLELGKRNNGKNTHPVSPQVWILPGSLRVLAHQWGGRVLYWCRSHYVPRCSESNPSPRHWEHTCGRCGSVLDSN